MLLTLIAALALMAMQLTPPAATAAAHVSRIAAPDFAAADAYVKQQLQEAPARPSARSAHRIVHSTGTAPHAACGALLGAQVGGQVRCS